MRKIFNLLFFFFFFLNFFFLWGTYFLALLLLYLQITAKHYSQTQIDGDQNRSILTCETGESLLHQGTEGSEERTWWFTIHTERFVATPHCQNSLESHTKTTSGIRIEQSRVELTQHQSIFSKLHSIPSTPSLPLLNPNGSLKFLCFSLYFSR